MEDIINSLKINIEDVTENWIYVGRPLKLSPLQFRENVESFFCTHLGIPLDAVAMTREYGNGVIFKLAEDVALDINLILESHKTFSINFNENLFTCLITKPPQSVDGVRIAFKDLAPPLWDPSDENSFVSFISMWGEPLTKEKEEIPNLIEAHLLLRDDKKTFRNCGYAFFRYVPEFVYVNGNRGYLIHDKSCQSIGFPTYQVSPGKLSCKCGARGHMLDQCFPVYFKICTPNELLTPAGKNKIVKSNQNGKTLQLKEGASLVSYYSDASPYKINHEKLGKSDSAFVMRNPGKINFDRGTSGIDDVEDPQLKEKVPSLDSLIQSTTTATSTNNHPALAKLNSSDTNDLLVSMKEDLKLINYKMTEEQKSFVAMTALYTWFLKRDVISELAWREVEKFLPTPVKKSISTFVFGAKSYADKMSILFCAYQKSNDDDIYKKIATINQKVLSFILGLKSKYT